MKIQFFNLTICAAIGMASISAWTGCMGGKHVAHNLPPAGRLMETGPGVGGPGPGVIQPAAAMMGGPGGMMGGPGGGAMMGPMMGSGGEAACYGDASCGPECPSMGFVAPSVTSQISFLGVEGGEIAWDVSGQGMFDSSPLVMPGRQNFSQGAIYRLKLTNLPEREGVELYPTLEIAPVTPRTDAYLAHAPIPIQFTDEDLDQVLSGNFVTKVIYLPDPEFQELALAGVETLVSTRLDPGVDPIVEADRRGSILAILRMGNLDLQSPGQMVARVDMGVQRAQFHDGSGSRGSYQQLPPQPTPESDGEEGYTSGDYGDQEYAPGEYGDEGSTDEGYYNSGNASEGYTNEGYVGESYGTTGPMQGNYPSTSGAPMGMSTASFAPQVIPPGAMSGVGGPQWGMPITGTPIGLPGPPHIPLGTPAGLTKHVMKNRTRVLMPPPVHKMKISVKQRPGMSYPRPVNHVKIDETNRAGFRLFGGTLTPALPALFHKMTSKFKKDRSCSQCQDGSCESCRSQY
jgi:hypothetical protein